jgi:predicted RecB family nuclease
MRRYNGQLLYSAGDLVTFLGCRRATTLDRRHLDEPATVATDDSQLKLLQEKGFEHESALKDRLHSEGKKVVDVTGQGSLAARASRTMEAMRTGADVIYQGAFLAGNWHGYADFLVRTNGKSNLGEYHYEPLDAKLAHSAKPKHVIQLAVYAHLVGEAQGRPPERIHVNLGTRETVTLRAADYRYYFEHARERMESYIAMESRESEAIPCAACSLCSWRERCTNEWRRSDHLTLVAKITSGQVEKLNASGVMTVAQLAAVGAAQKIVGIRPEVLTRLSAQARLQDHKRRTGDNKVEVLPGEVGKGFERLPQPNPGDLFFDMEGDPLYDGGLEYLFGFAYRDDGQVKFQPFWGHSRAEEKLAFERAMDFISARLTAFPDAHIYHYAAYEETAVKRLAMLHGTREAEVDDLLRRGKLIDLYRIVRESIQVSEPRYSIKNLERFYRPAREGEVSNAGESVVMYERWRKLQESQLLEEIEDYNRIDCISTLELLDWLLQLRPAGTPWHIDLPPDLDDLQREEDRKAANAQSAELQAKLLECAEEDRPVRSLVAQLLDFHKRESKPGWWFQFTRAAMPLEELIEDSECLGGLERDASTPPFPDKKSIVHTFIFPAQDFKMRKGDRPRRATSGREPVGEIVSVDENACRIQLKVGSRIPALGDAFSLIPGPPIDTKLLQAGVQRYANALISGSSRYAAITAILKRDLPRIQGRSAGAPVIPIGSDNLRGAIGAISSLDSSYLLVQGPPGAGKTYLSARAIVELLKGGKRVAIAANSHKAVNKLLEEVSAVAAKERVRLNGLKKCSDKDHECDARFVTNVYDNNEVVQTFNLVAGTAWLFARPELDRAFDHLFVDEAGQVSLGHLVAMSTCARNVSLIGDQMQLSQPIEGTHPGESGLSALDYLLKDYATIPPERGVFLDVTRRMHPDVCGFISDAVYESRLHSDSSCGVRRLVLKSDADSALKTSGLSWVPVHHQDRKQRCEEEGVRIAQLLASLLNQRWVESAGRERPLTVDDILVVSPYNMQVNLLQGLLPAGAVTRANMPAASPRS